MVVLVIGIWVSAQAYFVLENRGLQDIENEFILVAQQRFYLFQLELENNFNVLKSVFSFYESSEIVTRSEFRTFAGSAIRGKPGVVALGWVFPVSYAQRSDYEQAARLEGLEGFEITERDEERKLVKAGKRGEYFPVYYIHPYEGNEDVLGLDAGSEEKCRDVILKARDSGELAVTSGITRDRDDRYFFIGVIPVYRKNTSHDTAKERRENIKGYVIGVFHAGDIMEQALSYLMPLGIDIYLYDLSGKKERELLYLHRSRVNAKDVKTYKTHRGHSRYTDLDFSKQISVADRKWLINFKAVPGFAASGKNWRADEALFMGITLTILLSMYFAGSIRRTIQREILVKDLSREIQERERTERELELSRERYALAQEVANIGTWDWDVASGDVVWSKQIYRLFGFPEDEFNPTYERFFNCVHPDDKQHFTDSINECMDKGKEYDEEYRIICADGTVKWVSGKGNVFRDEYGKPARMMGTLFDITARRNMKDLILAKNKELESFVYTVSHDLKTPLVTIQGFLGLFRSQKGVNFGANGVHYLNRINANVEYMKDLIHDLLEFSRVGKKAAEPESVEITGLIHESARPFIKKMEDNGIKFDVEGEDKCRIFADKYRLKQLIDNLISNAVKFFDPDKKEKWIKIRCGMRGRNVLLSIKDNGIGIDPKYHEKIFEIFQRLKETSRDIEGTGVGLALVKKIVEESKGKIQVISAAGEGTEFMIELPPEIRDT